ncbi:MAG: phosphonate metabolism protein/1,5-bisphosphokinase (PRPP-forming) PhnN [Deltaproteobacteria bacterium]|jgi:ribose 1,5-bisphosphokinase|nr:phosphonate metabolism protein/1,5-bisphosphokinase (PRPP-forming) PhnN [Deltaproteobacteria bacterium]
MLVYVMGPSGAGKNALLDAVRDVEGVTVAVREVTRPAEPGERSLSPAEYEEALAAGRFVLHWRCHGLGYGLGRRELEPLKAGQIVVVNGSRAHLPQALKIFPDLQPVLIGCRPEELAARLKRRGREDEAGQAERLARAARRFELPASPPTAFIDNSGPLEDAAAELRALLRGWLRLGRRSREGAATKDGD